MSKQAPKNLSPLGAAALAFDEELQRFEHLAAAAQRLPLNSQKGLERAVRATNDAAECQRKMGELLQAFMAALNVARDQNQTTATAMEERRAEIQRRSDELGALMMRFNKLGEEARNVSLAVQKLGQEKPEPGQAAPALAEIEERMGRIVVEAQELLVVCRGANAEDMLSPVDSLRQQVQSARHKVSMLRQQVSAAPAAKQGPAQE